MIGRFALGVNTARFASTLAILSDAGVPLLRGLEAARQTLGNECLRRAVLDATARIEGGSGLGAALRQQKVFRRCCAIWYPAARRPGRCRACWTGRRRRCRPTSSGGRWR